MEEYPGMKLVPILVNQEFQDPVMMIPIPQSGKAILFDLGYCFRLKVRDIQRIHQIFISHTHIDHFAGFDHILRLSIDMDKTIEIFGPPGFIGNVRGKLAGYAWNLRENVHLNFLVTEVHPSHTISVRLLGKDGYCQNEEPRENPRRDDSVLATGEGYQVRTVFLEHRMPVLAYRIDGEPSLNADLSKIQELGLSPGPWLGMLKNLAREPIPPDTIIEAQGREFDACEMAKKILKKTPGTGIGYVVDTIFNKITARRLESFLAGVDHFFCECAYLKSEIRQARQNYHLTASQAGRLSAMAQVGTLHPFHFSRRYDGEYGKLFREAREYFPRIEPAKKYGE